MYTQVSKIRNTEEGREYMSKYQQNRPQVYMREFIRHFARRAGVTEDEAEELIEKFLQTLTESLLTKKSVCFPEFGIFELHPTTERIGRNPKTMEEHVIPAGVKPIFRPSRALRETVNQTVRNKSGKKT